ncbi:MAG: avidin/streptavidin family protein [Candidatus Thiodiazotropha sp. (ex Dulcina madagascariensis)]|nr:avidin/streptavidin family protein [Candidatus Thiodiazotropha sp. (ex Dulcina madagascariensis)]
MRIKNIVIASIFTLTSFSVCADGSASVSLKALSAWTNQSGSTLYVDTVDSNGLLTGTYINRAAGYGCQNISYPVTGWVYGTAIAFNTIWQSTTESCNSITAWTGFYYQGQINTLWQLTINGSTSTSQIIQGGDVFKPSSSIQNKSLILEK